MNPPEQMDLSRSVGERSQTNTETELMRKERAVQTERGASEILFLKYF